MNARIARWHIPSSVRFNCPSVGAIRFVFRHFPLTEVHPHAEIAAESAEFAGAAGLFWDMHDALVQKRYDDLPDWRRAGASRNSAAECP
jgi:hypothetical protein